MIWAGMLRSLTALFLLASGPVSAVEPPAPGQPEEWPRWRGPRGNGTWFGPENLRSWQEGDLQRVWSQPVGGGYAGVTAAGGRVYTMDRQLQPQERERILAFEAESGEPLWTFEYPVRYGDLPYGNGPRAAPTLFDGSLYSLGAMGHLHCLDASTGRLRWSHDLVANFNAGIPTWGLAASPLIFGEMVIVHAGARPNGSLLAFDRQTGREIWRNLPDPAGYATPILIQSQGKTQLIAWTPENIHGLDPQTGKLHWSIPYKVNLGVSIATPIFEEGIVFVSGYWEGSKAISVDLKTAQASLLWEENTFLRGLMSQPLYRNGVVYLLDKRFGLTCFELRSGQKLWDDGNRMTPRDRNPQASLVWLGDSSRVIILNAQGELILAELSRQGYRELSRAPLLGPTWAHPAYAGSSVFARDEKELVRVKLPVGGSSPRLD